MSSPSTVIRPALGASRPSSIAIVVVLPAPLAPSSAVVLPRGTAKLSSSTAQHRAVALGQARDDDRRRFGMDHRAGR